MKAVGIIVEYNPFHNGHYYHLHHSKKQTNADCIIAVMSGNFLQRGEPALVSKWTRTKMALEAGVDIVIELPYIFATQKADVFANGAISILHSLFCREVCFGSEQGTIDDFLNTVVFLHKNDEEYQQLMRQEIKKGYSYPKAASLAYSKLNINASFLDLSLPNNILGFHYVKAIKEQGYEIKPCTIKRTSAHYHDEKFSSPSIASATSIRKSLVETNNNIDEISNYIPSATKIHLQNYYNTNKTFHDWESYFHLLKYKLLTLSPVELQTIYEVEEGLENRLVANIRGASSFNDFMNKMKTKRYTWTRLQRLCLHVLTHATKKEMAIHRHNNKKTSYVRLLGMNKNGQNYLRQIKKDLKVPLIANVSSYFDEMIHLDLKVANTYACILPEPLRSNVLKQEYANPPIRYDEEVNCFIR